jgi:hypothetical protein
MHKCARDFDHGDAIDHSKGQAERLAACDAAIALLREIADLDCDDDGDVIIGTDADGQNDLMSRITAFLATNDQ